MCSEPRTRTGHFEDAKRPAPDMSGGWYTQSDSAGGSTGTVGCRLGCGAGTHWLNMVNTIEPCVCGGDAALCQITLTTCFLRYFTMTFARPVIIFTNYLNTLYCYSFIVCFCIGWNIHLLYHNSQMAESLHISVQMVAYIFLSFMHTYIYIRTFIHSCIHSYLYKNKLTNRK